MYSSPGCELKHMSTPIPHIFSYLYFYLDGNIWYTQVCVLSENNRNNTLQNDAVDFIGLPVLPRLLRLTIKLPKHNRLHPALGFLVLKEGSGLATGEHVLQKQSRSFLTLGKAFRGPSHSAFGTHVDNLLVGAVSSGFLQLLYLLRLGNNIK